MKKKAPLLERRQAWIQQRIAELPMANNNDKVRAATGKMTIYESSGKETMTLDADGTIVDHLVITYDEPFAFHSKQAQNRWKKAVDNGVDPQVAYDDYLKKIGVLI